MSADEIRVVSANYVSTNFVIGMSLLYGLFMYKQAFMSHMKGVARLYNLLDVQQFKLWIND